MSESIRVDLEFGGNHILQFQNQVLVYHDSFDDQSIPQSGGIQIVSGEDVTLIQSSLNGDQENQNPTGLQQSKICQTSSYYMRFDQQNTKNLLVSPSGLLCTNTDLKEQKGVAICSQGFSSGSHYWEIICPLSCEGIQVGIVMEGWDINQIGVNGDCHLLEFKTTTQRVIGLKLNLDEGTLKCLLNGNIHSNKGIGIEGEKIKPGTWFPVITLRGLGNMIMINPFAVDPDLPMNLYARLPQLAQQSQIDQQERCSLKSIDFGRQRKTQIENYTQVTSVCDRNLILLQNNRLKLVNINKAKIMSPVVVLDNRPINPTDYVTLQIPINEIANLYNLQECDHKITSNEGLDLWQEFLTSVSQGESQANVFTFKIQFMVAKIFFTNLTQFLQDNLSGQGEIFQKLKNNKNEAKLEQIKIGIVESTLDELKNLIGVGELEVKESKLMTSPQDANKIEQQKSIQILNLSYEQTYNVLSSVLNLDEQLQAMCLHQGASIELKEFLNSTSLRSQNRLFASFARLNTFLDTVASSDPLSLAEEGFFKLPGPQLTYGHFLQSNQEFLIDSNESCIETYFPDNRMLEGRQCGNVELSQTINNIPSIRVEKDLTFVKQKQVSPYFGLYNKGDEKMYLYNGELVIFEMCQIDLRKIDEATLIEQKVCQPAVKVPVEQQQQKKPKTDQVGDIFKILENYSNMDTKSLNEVPLKDLQFQDSIGGFLFGEQDQEIPVNNDFVGQLHAMGFPIDICKKALQRTQNEGLDKALDIIFEVQQEAQQFDQKQQSAGKKSTKTLLLLKEWQCSQCTLINRDQQEKCDACDFQAPQSAYYDPSDVHQLEEETNEVQLFNQMKKRAEEQALEMQIQQYILLEQEEAFRNLLQQKELTEISDCFLVEGDLNSPLLVCTVLNSRNKNGRSVMAIKKVSYSKEYLESFFTPIDKLFSASEKGYVCTPSNEWTPEQLTPQLISNILLSNPNSNYLVRTLYPVFSSSCRQDFKVVDETLIEYPVACHILAADYVKQEDTYTYIALVQDNFTQGMCLYIHEVRDNTKPVLKQNIPIKISGLIKDMVATLSEDKFVCLIASDTHLLEISVMNNPTFRDCTPSSLQDAKILSISVQNTQVHLLVQDYNKTYLLTLKDNEVDKKHDSTFEGINMAQITLKELQNLESLIEIEPIQFQSNSSHLTGAFNGVVRKHSISGSFELKLKPVTKSTIINLDLDILLTKKSNLVVYDNLQFNKELPVLRGQLEQLNDKSQSQMMYKTDEARRFFHKPAGSEAADSNEYQRIPLTFYSFTGSQFNFKTSVTKFLYPHGGAFTPNYPNAEFVLRHLHGKRMTPMTVTVGSGLKNVKCGFPLGSGLIFTADHPSQFNLSSCFAGMSLAAYKEWAMQRKNFSEPIKAWEPVGCFEFEDCTEQLTISLDVQRACNYMLLKPTNFRKKPYDNTIYFKKNPLEIKLFEVHGYEINSVKKESCSYRQQSQPSTLMNDLLKQVSIRVKYHGSDEFEELDDIKNAIQVSEHLVNQLEHGNHSLNHSQQISVLQHLTSHGVCVDASMKVRVTHKQMQNNEIDEVQILVRGDPNQDWEVTYLTVAGSKPIDLSPMMQQRFEFSNELRFALLNIESYDIVNAKILQMITDGGVEKEKRFVAMKLLIRVANFDLQLLDITFQALDLKKFIELNLLTIENDVQEQAVTQFMTLYESKMEFPAQLNEVTQVILHELQSREGLLITQRGLLSLTNVIRFLADQYPEQILATLTQQFNDVLDHIESIKSGAQYQQLTELGLNGSYLDDGLFSTQYLNLVGISETCVFSSDVVRPILPVEVMEQGSAHPNPGGMIHNRNIRIQVSKLKPLPSRFIQYVSKNQQQIRSFSIDLLGCYDLDRISLRFNQHENFMIRFRVQVWAYQGSTKHLLIDQSCGEWILVQVACLAYKNQTLGKDLETLGFPLHFRARYLQVQLTFGQTASIKYPADNSNIPTKAIVMLPELWGTLCDGDVQKHIVPHLNNVFEDFDTTKLIDSNIILGGSLVYKQFEIRSKMCVYDSAGIYDGTSQSRMNWTKNIELRGRDGTDQPAGDGGQLLRQELKSLQSQLGQQMKEVANKIISVQKQLLEVQPCISSTNLSFQYTFCYHILQLLRDIHHDLKEKPHTNSKQSLAITNRIFYGLLMEDEGPLVMQARSFLSEQLIDNISESEWIHFILGAYETQDLDVHLAKNLKDIPIPLKETIKYITLNLHYNKVPLENSIHQQVQNQQKELGYTRLVSLLGLVVGWYAQVPTFVVGQTVPNKYRMQPNHQLDKMHETDHLSQVYNLVVSENDELLQRAFFICTWTTQQKLDRDEFDGLFGLAVDLLIELIRINPSSSIVQLINSLTNLEGGSGDPTANLLVDLITAVLKINSQSSMNKLQVLLEQLFNVHETPDQYKDWLSVQSLEEPLKQHVLDEQVGIGYIRRSIIFSTQYLLLEVVDHAKGTIESAYSEHMGEFNANLWIEHLQFIIDFLIYSVDRLNADIKDSQQMKMKQPNVQRRKLSTDTRREEFSDFLHITMNKMCWLCDPSIVRNLIHILSSGECHDFAFSHSIWQITFRVVLKIKPYHILEEKLFQNIVTVFLSVRDEVQQTMFTEILTLANNLLQSSSHYQKDLSNTVLNVLFDTITSYYSSSRGRCNIKYNLIKGWLTTLQPIKNQSNIKVHPLTIESTQSLLIFTTNFLYSFGQFGGVDGILAADLSTLQCLEVGEGLVQLLINAEDESETPMLRKLFSCKPPMDLQGVFSRLIQWSIVNHNTTATGSPAQDLIARISESVFQIYERVGEHQNYSTICLTELFKCQYQVDQIVLPLLQKHKLSVFLSYGIVFRALQLLESLFDIWIINDEVAREVAFNGGGFDYLLDKMGISKCPIQQDDAIKQDPSSPSLSKMQRPSHYHRKGRKQTLKRQQTLNYSLVEHTLNHVDELKEEELATNVNLINLPGQVAVQPAVDWSVNKKSVKSRILLLSMTGVNHDEYQMVLKLDRVCEIKDLFLGFQVFTTDFADKVLACPSAVYLEVSCDQQVFYPVGKMSTIEDEAYTNNCIKVFSKNFLICPLSSSSTNLESYLTSLQHRRVQYLKFRIRRPQITMVEGYTTQQKSYKNISLAINFLSIRGHDVSKLPECVNQSINNQQERSALNIIGKLCTPRFSKTLFEMANNEILLKKVKISFEKFAHSLTNYEQQLSPLILAIAKHNTKLGDWIVDQFLDTKRSLVHAKLLNEIILSNPLDTVNRVKKLHDFVIHHLVQVKDSDYQSITPFIDSYSVVLLISARNQQVQTLAQPEPLSLTFDEMKHFVNLYSASYHLASSKLLIKLIVNLIYMPYPYQIQDEQLSLEIIELTLDYVWQLSYDKAYMLELLAPIVIGSEQSITWFLRTNKLIKVVDYLLQVISTLHQGQIRCILWFLNVIAQIPQCANAIIEHDQMIRVYKSLFELNSKENLIKNIEQPSLALVTSFISSVVQSHPREQIKIVQQLVTDIKRLGEVRDMQFVSHLLVPLLNSEHMVPVCLHFWDEVQKKFITDPRKLVNMAQSGALSNLINPFVVQQQEAQQIDIPSKILNQSDKSRLNEHFSTMDLPKGQSWYLVATQDVDSDEHAGKKVLSQMIQHAPFLMILRCSYGASERRIVMFVNQIATQLQYNEYEFEYDIKYSKEAFAYCSDEVEHCFYEQSEQDVGEIHSYDGQMEIYLQFGDKVRVELSYILQQASNVVVQMPKDTDLYNYVIQDAEYWVYKTPQIVVTPAKFVSVTGQILNRLSQQSSSIPAITSLGYGGLNQLVFSQQHFKSDSPYNYFRATPIYYLPANLMLEQVKELIVINQMTIAKNHNIPIISVLSSDSGLKLSQLGIMACLSKTNGIVDVEVNALQLIESLVQQADAQCQSYPLEMTIFQVFEQQDGVRAIIKVVQDGIKKWSNTQRAQVWSQYIDELWSFCFLPTFFNIFMKNKQCVELLFQLLAGVPDELDASKSKKWDDEEQTSVKFIYSTLIEIFRTQNTSQVRELALEQDLLTRILDRIALVSKEKKRVWSNQPVEQQITIQTKLEEEVKKKPQKKKGVGYASDNTGQNTKWNTQDYVDSKKVRNEQLKTLLAIAEQFFDFNNWHITQVIADKILKTLYQSALLPLLEAAFRSGSLLEMTKEADLYQGFMKLVMAISKHRVLAPVFLEIPCNYIPQQAESLQTLLTNLKGNANIYLNCMMSSQVTNEEQSQSSQALSIINTHTAMENMINRFQLNQSDSEEEIEEDIKAQNEEQTANELIKEILLKPLPEAYRLLLQDLRFDYVSMKEHNKYKHHYSSSIQANHTPSQNKLVRLAQEFADMSTALPIEHTNAIFCRADKESADVMKAMVMGAKGTPYAHGAYIFDIFFDDNYPNGPPKMNLSTTGAGNVRFNPNLYSCGKVCLSLLGTWRGNASENWDPKISTLLQVLVSTQAIIMSEEIYFNEPGFERESGTEEGDKKNEAYSNIVRYSNIKFAMIQQLKTPPKGFESVVKRHFYLKKDEILEECRLWVQYAEQREASYTGLINDHNTNWCTEFKSSRTKYKDMLVEAIKELEAEFAKLQPPNASDLKGSKLLNAATRRQNKSAKKQRTMDIKDGMANLDEVDISDDKVKVLRGFNILDESVRDRWSRYIGAMGIDAVQKQSAASVFLSGMGALGIEIAKNVVLSGVKRFTIHDTSNVQFSDLTGQFFVSEDDVGHNRAVRSLNKIQQLNYYVRADTLSCDVELPSRVEDIEAQFPTLKTYQAIILAKFYPNNVLVAWNRFCRLHGIKLIVCSVQGVFGRILNDWGDDFVVLDKNGEQGNEVMIKEITISNPGKVELLTGSKHDLEDGDMVVINNVQGMTMKTQESSNINGTYHKIKVINKSSFHIDDTTIYTEFIRNGTIKLVKVPIPIKFQPLEEIIADHNLQPAFDQFLSQSDFMKMDNPIFAHIAYQTMNVFIPKPWNHQDLQQFLEVSKKFSDLYITGTDNETKLLALTTYLTHFALIAQVGEFAPLSAFLGGFAAQELIKSLTNKFMPIQQVYYTDCTDILPDLDSDLHKSIDSINLACKDANRRSSIISILGEKLTQQLEETKLFMIGCGAIGCELLKNFAMLNIGASGVGSITITDPDHIETSNLNRQFLFREKHIRKPKSSTAAAAVIHMNPSLKGRVIARFDKVYEGSENVFTDKFFKELTIVANALDNIQARRYVDIRCVNAKIPLLESGTLGTKGHVQVIIPYLTESYGSSNDPVEEGDIPYCTLKMFPEETFHCVEFARDKFGKLFTLRPKAVEKILEDPNYKPSSPEEIKALREAVKLVKNVPANFSECIIWARRKFQKYFVNDIKQLLFTYPLDQKTKEGKNFWTMPKRPPQHIEYDSKNSLHIQFVSTFAFLRANLFNIPTSEQWRQQAQRNLVAEQAMTATVKPWVPSEEKKKSIANEVLQKEKKIDPNEQNENQAEDLGTSQSLEQEQESLLKELSVLRKIHNSTSKQLNGFLKPEEFEKDDDQNGHIDFIHAFGNLRAANYKLEEMDWLTVKIKAGRIVPALATTTAVVAGLQTIELCKTIKKCKLENMKNAFINLAIPYIQLTEPASAPKTVLHQDLIINLWDRWDHTLPRQSTLKDLFEVLEKTYQLTPVNVFLKSAPIYMATVLNKPGQEKEREKTINSKLINLLGLSKDDPYIDLTINFTNKDSQVILQGVPIVRVIFSEK